MVKSARLAPLAVNRGHARARLRLWLLRLLREARWPASERITLGNSLASLGDPRFSERYWYLPDEALLGFVEIPAGPFLMGSDWQEDPEAMAEEWLREIPKHRVDLPTYWLARYPVTVAQWQTFVTASKHEPGHADSLKGVANHPAIWITWYDGLAYCGWLEAHLRAEAGQRMAEGAVGEGHGFWRGLARGELRVTLPSEAEWEKAARGSDGRRYPWGNEGVTPERANYGETQLDTTSPVGSFPGGASPYGCQDLAGNVWEWTRTIWGEQWGMRSAYPYPYQAEDGREELLPDSHHILRLLRGGAYHLARGSMRCAARHVLNPDQIGGAVGLRLAVSPLSP